MGVQAAVAGYQMVTTLDLKVQQAAEVALPDSVRGAIVAIDPRNGEILAMVSSPRLDPNIFSLKRRERNKGWAEVALDSMRPLTNRAISGVYPPGSVFKLITTGAGLEYKVVNRHSHMAQPCTGGYQFGARYQKCWGKHGSLDLCERNQAFLRCLYVPAGPYPRHGKSTNSGTFRPRFRARVDIPGERSGWLPIRRASTPGINASDGGGRGSYSEPLDWSGSACDSAPGSGDGRFRCDGGRACTVRIS